jgi:ABC-type lipoprotein export system ATPase subunit
MTLEKTTTSMSLDPTTSPVAVCDGASVTYGRGPTAVVALVDATCSLFRGDHIAVMGRSGSGKSTLLHLLAGLQSVTTGTVAWPGIGSIAELRPGPVGIVFQSPSLIPSLDVVENVTLPLVLMGRDRVVARRAATDALNRLDVEELAQKLPEELSGGQAQRVAVARVLAHRPTLILADEPSGQLDHAAAAVVIDALIEAATDVDAALVVSTHDPEIVARLDRQWSITDGVLLANRTSWCSV